MPDHPIEQPSHEQLRQQLYGGVHWLLAQWRYLLFLGVLIVAIATFRNVTTTGQPDRVSTLPEAVYRAFTLFVLESDGTPHHGTRAWLLAAWSVYFLAPLIVLSAFIETIQRVRRALASPERVVRRMRNHFIVCGYGKNGRMVLDTLKRNFPDQDAVVVDSNPALEDFIQVGDEQRVPVIRADVRYDLTNALLRAQIGHAQELVVATGDDMLNLSTCVAAHDQQTLPDFRSIVLVSDIDFTIGFTPLMQALDYDVRLINTYEIAAGALLDRLAEGDDPLDPNSRNVVILGFGRFGRMLTKQLLARWPDVDRRGWLTIVDLNAETLIRNYARRHPAAKNVLAVSGDVSDPSVIDEALSAPTPPAAAGRPLIVLCTDCDTTNLRTAMIVREFTGSEPVMLTRMFDRPPRHFEELLSGHQIQCFELRDLISAKLEL